MSSCVKYLSTRFPFLATEPELRQWVGAQMAVPLVPYIPRPTFQEVATRLERKLAALQAADSSPNVYPAPPPPAAELQAIQASLNSPDALNHYLAQLKALFPAVPAARLRAQLGRFDRQHVRLSAEALLQAPIPAAPPSTMAVASCDRFRSPEYRKAARNSLLNEFPMLWEYQVRAVLAEQNYDYTEARAQCETINRLRGKGWFDWLARKAKKVPFVWELQGELAAARVAQDAAVAACLNREEYEQAEQLLECGCCCDEVEAERACACLAGHLLCHECVQKRTTEQTYSPEPLSPLRCFTCEEDCDQPLRPVLLQRALGPALWAAYSTRLAEAELLAAAIPAATCPFCRRVSLVAPPPRLWQRVQPRWWRIAAELALLYLSWRCFPLLFYTTTFICVAPRLLTQGLSQWSRDVVTHCVWGSLDRLVENAQRCANRDCQMLYCLRCFKEAHRGECQDRVYPPTLDGLRTYVEEAMARVTMRVCPDCGLHFQKESGCNKMTCRCGATMCYLCRASLRDVGYAHFCPHPRTIPGTRCGQCDRCELFREPDFTEDAKRAAREAKVDFLRQHPHLKVTTIKIGTLIV
eukprot:EG_transcript_6363